MNYIFSLFFIFFSFKSFGASCCGGGASLPGIILNDSKAKLSSSLSYQKVMADVDGEARARLRKNNSNTSRIFSLDGAYLLSDYAQVSISLPYYQNKVETLKQSESSQNIGDISSAFIYEYAPEQTYSLWKPRGFFYSKITAPSGTSNKDSDTTLRSDITGQGHWVFSLGFPFYKLKGNFDLLLAPEIFYKLQNTALGAAYGGSLLASFGYSPKGEAWRLGTAIRSQYQSKQKIQKIDNTHYSAIKSLTDVMLNLSYAFNPRHSLGINYNDQTVFGPAKNSTLSSGIALIYTTHWPL